MSRTRTKPWHVFVPALLALLPLLSLAHGISEEDRQRMLDGGYLQYVLLGASHMLTGYELNRAVKQ